MKTRLYTTRFSISEEYGRDGKTTAILNYMNLNLHEIPERIAPYILTKALNESVDIAAGSFQLATAEKVLGAVDGRLYFRWLPSTAMEFDACYSGDSIRIGVEDVTLSVAERGLSAPVIISSLKMGPNKIQIRGIFRNKASLAARPNFDRVRFCLANFPEYIGHSIKYQSEGSEHLVAGRLRLESPRLVCIVDKIPEVEALRKAAAQDAGFFISHVGELRLVDSQLNEDSSEELLNVLRLFFGFLRGAWSGPVFPQGLVDHEKVWEQIASWIVGEPKKVATWLPQLNPLDLNALFAGFVELHSDPRWQSSLRTALHWYVEANSSGALNETRLVMAQVALELLAWLEVVKTRRGHSHSDFKRLSAAGRIRSLLRHLRIPCEIPSHLDELQSLENNDAFDGPGVIVLLRNALVHAGEKIPEPTKSDSGIQGWQASQLALQYLELSLLALCGYQGKYARRGWRGWKGEDEVLVPWVQQAISP